MRCSVIIPVHNRASLTRQCLETLFADRQFASRFEVVVVDDGSTDETHRLLAEFGGWVKVVRHEAPTGFARACNDGAAQATGENFAFLNNDTMPMEGWLDALVRYADAHPRAAVVGAKLLFPDDTIQHAGITITHDLNPRHIYAGFPGDHPAVNKSRRFPAVTAACAFFRRGSFEEEGGFDEAFTNGFEDIDLCLRLDQRGYEVHYCHESVAYHLEMGTRDFRDEFDNLDLYRRRWADRVRPDAIDHYIEDGLLEIEYGLRYPFVARLSPQLGVVEEEARELERLVAEQTHKLAELQRENVGFRILATDAGLEPPPVALGPARSSRPESPRAVLFVSGVGGDSLRYRCKHFVEALRAFGATADASRLHQLPLGDVVDSYGCFVLHRVADDEHVESFIQEIHRRRKAVIFDTDEDVFADDCYAGTIAAADAVFVPTEALAQSGRATSDHVVVLQDLADEEILRSAENIARAASSDTIRLGYVSQASGADTEFAGVADLALWALAHDPRVRLILVGDVRLDHRFERLRGSIEQIPAQPVRRRLPLLATIDVSLVPLNPGSELSRSWLEPAIVGTPSASDRDALGELLASPERRWELGRAAMETVVRDRTTDAASETVASAFSQVTRAAVADRKLTINWLLDTGDSRLARIAGELGWRGHRVRVFGESVPRSVQSSVEVRPSSAELPAADVVVARDATPLLDNARGLFCFSLASLQSNGTLDAESVEEALLERCFARLDPEWTEDGR